MVRVAADRSETRSAWLSLIAAVGVALLAIGAFTTFREPAPSAAPQRILTDYPARWTCELNPTHEFTAVGRYESLPCRFPGCSGHCFIRQRFVCPDHGSFDAWIQLSHGATRDDEYVTRYRYSYNGTWRVADGGRVPCPRAGCSAATRPQDSAWSEHNMRQAAHTDTPPLP